MAKDTQARKYQLTFNNPVEYGWAHEKIRGTLCSLTSLGYWCLADEIGEQGTLHTHLFCSFENPKRFSTMKNAFPEAHIESAKGTCQQNRDYVTKTGKWADTNKSETSVPGTFEEGGDIPQESSLPHRESEIMETIQEDLENGHTPREILARGVVFFKYEKIIKSAYFSKRLAETPAIRDLTVHYLVGEAGSGKSYHYKKLCDQYGSDQIYLLTDYANGGTGGFDGYNGEPILFMDEFKSQLPYGLLLQILDKYPVDIHARYSNVKALWTTVFITSVFPPEMLYSKMVTDDMRNIDSFAQLKRRITFISYCFIKDKEYAEYQIPMKEYLGYQRLKHDAEHCELLPLFGTTLFTCKGEKNHAEKDADAENIIE